jgi:hypothetical protein
MDSAARHDKHAACFKFDALTVAHEGEASFQHAEEFVFEVVNVGWRTLASGYLCLEHAEASAGLMGGDTDKVRAETQSEVALSRGRDNGMIEGLHLLLHQDCVKVTDV